MKKLLLIFCFIFSLSTAMGCCVAVHEPSHPSNQLVEHLNQSTVELISEARSGTGYHTYCSGFWITDYHLVTAAHCVENDEGKTKSVISFNTYEEFSNKFPPDDPKKVYSAVVIAVDSMTDLAVLKSLDDVDHHILNISDNPIPNGTLVHSVGHPIGMEYSYLRGIVSATRLFDLPEMKKKAKVLQIDASLNRGSSGCAVTDSGGNVVGITSFLHPRSVNFIYLVHRDELTKLLDKAEVKYH